MYNITRASNIDNFPMHLCIFKNVCNLYTNSFPVIYPKKDCSDIKIWLEYAKRFHVTGVWPPTSAIALAKSPVSTIITPLGAIFAPSSGYLFILFINVPGVWPYSAAIVLAEALITILLPPLGAVTLGVDGLFLLTPHNPPPDICL